MAHFKPFNILQHLKKSQPSLPPVKVHLNYLGFPFWQKFSELLSVTHAGYDTWNVTGDFNIHVYYKQRAFRIIGMSFKQHFNVATHKYTGFSYIILSKYQCISSLIWFCLAITVCFVFFLPVLNHALPSTPDQLLQSVALLVKHPWLSHKKKQTTWYWFYHYPVKT